MSDKDQPIELTMKDFKNIQWKNGGGTTCELFKQIDESEPESF